MPGYCRNRSRSYARGKKMKKKLALIAVAFIVFNINLQRAASAPKHTSSIPSRRGARPARLGSVEQFKAAFQSDEGKVRLVALVSPT